MIITHAGFFFPLCDFKWCLPSHLLDHHQITPAHGRGQEYALHKHEAKQAVMSKLSYKTRNSSSVF